MTYVGAITHGNSATAAELADHASVFMFCHFGDSYVQPTKSFCLKKCNKRHPRCAVVASSNRHAGTAGAKVHGFVCDDASTNQSMWNILGISGKMGDCKNFFSHPSDPSWKLFPFSDMRHFIKCICNRLKKQRYQNKNGDWMKLAHACWSEGLSQDHELSHLPFNNWDDEGEACHTNFETFHGIRHKVLQ